MLLFLTACGGASSSDVADLLGIDVPQSTGNSTGTEDVTKIKDRVYDFRAFPNNNSVTLSWNNPNSDIEFYNLSVYAGDEFVANASNTHLNATDGVNLTRAAIGVKYAINHALMNNVGYSFEISVHLVGDDALNISRPVVRLGGRRNTTISQSDAIAGLGISSLTTKMATNGDVIIIGPNQDGDEYADLDDGCPNSPPALLNTPDSDKDGCFDAEDALPQDPTEWLDRDGDGLGNNADPNDDNDDYLDTADSCPVGVINWVANDIWDYDRDGCHDAGEDLDDDNDLVADTLDFCRRGAKGWLSSNQTDYDSDGCRDSDEDADDDGDRIVDQQDSCQLSIVIFRSTLGTDNDQDGCNDLTEDADDDNDGVNDYQDDSIETALDNCQFDYNPNQEDIDSDQLGDLCDDDKDNDGVNNDADADDDGNGLIEIASAADLDRVRYNLGGQFLGMADTTPTAAEQGCVTLLNGAGACYGYELVANINLRSYPNWQPIGSCRLQDDGTSGLRCEQSAIFNAVFDGRNYTISRINISPDAIAPNAGGGLVTAGLFGSVGGDVILRDINLRDVTINGAATAELTSSSNYVGALAGLVYDTDIIDVTLTNGVINATTYAGGLVGYAHDCTILSSSVELIEVSVSNVAPANRAKSAAAGLVGSMNNCELGHSYAATQSVMTTAGYAGGLVGMANSSQIYSSHAINGLIASTGMQTQAMGGLVGAADNSQVYASLSWTDNLVGAGAFNNFIGVMEGASRVGFSYAYDAPRDGDAAAAFAGIARNSSIVLENSYVISANADHLWRGATTPNVRGSYWDSDISSATADSNARTSVELKSLDEFTGIYGGWDAAWCDPATGTFTTDESVATTGGFADNLVWDLGTEDEYPLLSCLNSFSKTRQLIRGLD